LVLNVRCGQELPDVHGMGERPTGSACAALTGSRFSKSQRPQRVGPEAGALTGEERKTSGMTATTYYAATADQQLAEAQRMHEGQCLSTG
jgi:hypothetical protein